MLKDENRTPDPAETLSRRDFIQSVAVSGAGLMLSQAAFAQAPATAKTLAVTAEPPVTTSAAPQAPAFIKNPGDVINVGVIGVGAEGQVLVIDSCLFKAAPIKGIRFKAICDIWPYQRKRVSGILRALGHPNNQYEDYREMLAKEKDLHAVIVATPDWMHAEHTIACLEAGLHVYCEKEMSNNLEKARQMVEAQRRTGKLLQIGHQRRSNPRYRYAINDILRDRGILGRVAQANAQWNRSKTASQDIPANPKVEIAPEILAKYGYDSMHNFLNWRWYRKYGGGPIVDLGSHQIDIFSWVFQANPKAVVASGGADIFKNHEWFDTVMCVYEYDSPVGPARAFYQVLTTTSNGGFYETFMGDEGTLVISENPKQTKVLRETNGGPVWDKWLNAGVLKKKADPPIPEPEPTSTVTIARASKPPEEWMLPFELARPIHQPHLQNFFDAIRGQANLNCPAEVGYETAVAVLAVNHAIETGQRIEFKPEDFKVA